MKFNDDNNTLKYSLFGFGYKYISLPKFKHLIAASVLDICLRFITSNPSLIHLNSLGNNNSENRSYINILCLSKPLSSNRAYKKNKV